MALKILDPKMNAKLPNVVDKKMSEMSSRFEAQLDARLTDRVKEGMIEFCRCLWSWSLLIKNKNFWPVKKIVQRRWLNKVAEEIKMVCEVGFD